MAGPAAVLRELHRLRVHADDLRERLGRLPLQLKAQQTRVEREEQRFEAEKEKLQKLKVGLSDKEKTLAATHQQIAKYKKQTHLVTSKKELEALKSQMETAHVKAGEIEEEIIRLMEEVEQQSEVLPKQEAKLAEAKKDRQAFESSMGQREKDLRQMLAEAEGQLKEKEPTLPGAVAQEYLRLIRGKGTDALSPAENGTCQACANGLTPQEEMDLVSESFVICNACGRILYHRK